MKAVSTEMTTLLTGYQFFVAELYTITLANGDVYRWTSGDGNLNAAHFSQPYSFLCHFDSSPAIDTSGNGHVISSEGAAAIYNADAVFGSSCADLGIGAIDRSYTFLETDVLNFASNDFTIRLRSKCMNSAGGHQHVIFSNGYGVTIKWLFDSSQFVIALSYSGTANEVVVSTAGSYPYGSPSQMWRALSLEVHNHILYFYVDGVLAITPTALTLPIFYALNRVIYLGVSWWGFMDECLIYNGVSMAQGASSYTVETQPYTDYSVSYYDYLAKPIERGDITTATGVKVDDCTITLQCPMDYTINSLSLPSFAIIGGFDNAHVKIECAIMPAYGDTSAGVLHLFEGYVSDIKIDISKVELTVSAESIRLDTQIPTLVYQPSCTHTHYDSGCALSRAPFTASCTVVAGSDKGHLLFVDVNGVGFFDLGKVTFTSGLNNALTRTVKTHTVGAFSAVALTENLPFSPAVGDTFTITAGCDKLRSTCTAKFNNAVHFLGWEYMPVPEASL